MKAFKLTPLRFIYILFPFLATTTATLAAGPNLDPISDTDTAVLGSPFGPYQIATDTDGTPDAPLLYNAQGLPAGLSLDPQSGEITGTPAEAGVFTVELFATNVGGTGNSGTLTITVIDPITLPVITSPLAITADADAPYTYTITASNSPTSFSVLGLPAMDTDAISPIDPTTGIFSFTPSVSGVGDIINLLIGATNSQGTDYKILQVTISPSTTAPTSPDTVTVDAPLAGSQIDPQLTSTIDVSANVTPATGSTIHSVAVYWNNPPAKPDGTPRNPIILTSLNGPAAGGEFSGTINLGFDPENQELGGGNIDLEIRAYQTNAVNSIDYTSDIVNFRVGPLLEVLFPDDNLERGPFSLGDIFASARISTNQFNQITARISGPGIVNEVVDSNNLNNPNGVFNFGTLEAIDFGGPYDVTVTLEDNFQVTTVETKRFFIRNNSGLPSAVIISPTPGFTNVVFTPALFTFDQQGVRRLTRNDDGDIIRTEITYLVTEVSPGQGYYPTNASGLNFDYNFIGDNSGDADVSGNVTTNGRLLDMSRSLDITTEGECDGYGSSGNGFVDDSDDPGLYSRFDIAADFSSGGVQLESFKIFVNGAEILDGNLNPNNGPLDPPIVSYPASGDGHLLPGIYVVVAQLFDANGSVASSNPLTFEILPYEPFQITLQRYLASGANPSDPVLLNNPYSLLAGVDPINESRLVEFFESGSNTKLGEGSRVEIDGKGYYQFTHAFEAPGNFEVYAQVTAIDGRIAISAPVDITVITGEIPEVEITSPADGNRINPGETLEISI
ncbi:MAG: Ig domain-containing protein, partial [Verrucomicrobiota bacterium]|nr:Ig domain-containing protein [Verrucomicrobiota bacterium]